MQPKKKCFLIPLVLLTILNVSSGQVEVQLQSDLNITGNITIGQNNTTAPTAGMIRFDTMSNLFLGYNGETWIDLGALESEVNTMTDTLEIGDLYGGGVVFHTAGPNGLVVTEFDLADPNNVLDEDIPWGNVTPATGATDQVNGKQNTIDIIAALQNWSNGSYAAKICDDLDSGGFTDWYLPSVQEFLLMNQNVGTEATINVAQVGSTVYWTSTEVGQINANFYRTNSSQGSGISNKSDDTRVRAIRAY